MSLRKYKTKRKFNKTPEPVGKVQSTHKKLRFVVQKHDASRLHYDFRLELHGVLKSWAVPKGPSLNPEDKRLAMMVEDHPLDYSIFEGVIPEGNYGAGEVIVWDAGTYKPAGETAGKYSARKAQQILSKGLKNGHVDFFLEGEKLNGTFSLIRIRSSDSFRKGVTWLLIKQKDKYASGNDVTLLVKSVLSDKVLTRDTARGSIKPFVEKNLKKAHKDKGDKNDPSELQKAADDISKEVKLSNLNKIYWPKEKYTKGDLIKYYQDVSPVILPYLRDRPQSLNRHPDGIKGENFFQKNFTYKLPRYVEIVKIRLESEQKTIKSIVCQNIQTLLYLANLGCIEINPWNSRIQDLDKPDYLILDLDPEGISFNHVVETARTAHRILDKAGIESFCKTSGKTGLHIYVPLGARYTNDQVRQFAEIIAKLVHNQYPKYTSVVRKPQQRKGRVYVDYLQNRYGQTLAAPYSVRPWPGATVSAPLLWKEVKRGLDPSDFTMKNILKRIDKIGDIWKPVLGPGVDVIEVLGKLI